MKLRYFLVLLLLLVAATVPAYGRAADCADYLLVVYGANCGFCSFTGGWENPDGSLSCNYSCSWQLCKTA